MFHPVIYVDRSDVREGRLAELKTAIAGLARLVEEREPRIVAYDAYLSEDEAEMTVMHVHADAASLAEHMRVIDAELPRFADLVRLREINVYGAPGEEVMGRLLDKARRLGRGSVHVHPHLAGFARLSAPAPIARAASPLSGQP